MERYLILIESNETGYSAYSPDLPGCVAIGSTREEVDQNMQEAVEFHLEGLQLEGFPIPTPQTAIAYIEIAASRMLTLRIAFYRHNSTSDTPTLILRSTSNLSSNTRARTSDNISGKQLASGDRAGN